MPTDESILIKMGERIKKTRGDMTQKEFADTLEVSPQAVSEWENGNKMPRVGVIERMSLMYNRPVGYFFGEDAMNAAGISVPQSTIPIISSIERNAGTIEQFTAEEIDEIAKQMEFSIQYVKSRRKNIN